MKSTDTRFIVAKTNRSGLTSTEIQNGVVYFLEDTGEIYFDYDSKRIGIKDIEILETEDNRTSILFVPLNKFYFVIETQILWLYKDGTWYQVSAEIDSELSSTSTNPVQNNVIYNALLEKANTADLSTVATTGSYNDLTNTPDLTIYSTKTELEEVQSSIPTNISQLTNDSGYLTEETDPIYTAEKDTLALKTEIPTKVSELTNDSGYLTEHQDISGKADKSTTLAGYGIEDAYTKTEIDNKLTSAMHYKGTVDTVDDLPTSAETGDVYNITDTGDNYAWDGTAWDKLSGVVDLSSYLTIETAADTYSTKTELEEVEAKIPTVTDTYSSTGTDAVSGIAVASAISTKQDAGNYVEKTDLTDITVLGVTKNIQSIDGEQLYFPNGAIFGGTAASAGLVTRGICGVVTPFTSGDGKKYVYKENLYINYDGSNEYTRQLVLSAANAGTKIDNTTNGYTYCAIRGDDMVQYVTAAVSGKANTDDLATVATSGSYNDLTNTPTNVSTFTNDAGYLTEHQDISGKVDKVTTTDYVTVTLDTNNYGIAFNVENDTNSAKLCICENQGLITGYDSDAILSVFETDNPLIRYSTSTGYTILDTGVEVSELETTSKTVIGAINELKSSNWIGTAEEYETAKTDGTITSTTLCIITDDGVDE